MPLLSAPRLYGERVPVKLLRTSNSKVRQKIVDTHNYLRTQVKPPAANMLVMVSHLCMFRTSYFCSNFKFRSSFVRTYPYNRCTFSNVCLNDIILLYFIRKESNDNIVIIYNVILLYKRKFYKVLSDYCTFNTG